MCWPRRMSPRVGHRGDRTLPNAVCEPERARFIRGDGIAAGVQGASGGLRRSLTERVAGSSEPCAEVGGAEEGEDGAARFALVSCFAAYLTRAPLSPTLMGEAAACRGTMSDP